MRTWGWGDGGAQRKTTILIMQTRPDICIWTELLAFDNAAEDCGGAAYFDAMGFVPEGISLLLIAKRKNPGAANP